MLYSCIDQVRFEEPQPEGQSNEKKIPKRLIGHYISLNDSAELKVTNRLIIKSSISVFSGKVDSTDMKGIKGDTIYSTLEDNMKVDVRVTGDSGFLRWRHYDTLFDVSRGDILRKYKGRYFLNEKVSANVWRVTLLTNIHKAVTLGTISVKNDIDNLRDLTETKSDTVFSFRPTKKEMKKFLNAKGFSDSNTFIKIN